MNLKEVGLQGTNSDHSNNIIEGGPIRGNKSYCINSISSKKTTKACIKGTLVGKTGRTSTVMEFGSGDKISTNRLYCMCSDYNGRKHLF